MPASTEGLFDWSILELSGMTSAPKWGVLFLAFFLLTPWVRREERIGWELLHMWFLCYRWCWG